MALDHLMWFVTIFADFVVILEEVQDQTSVQIYDQICDEIFSNHFVDDF